MMNDKVQIQLWQVRNRVDRQRRRWSHALLAALLLAACAGLYLANSTEYLWQRNVWIGALAFAIVWLLVTRLVVKSISPNSETLARLVESRYPELRQSLITAVDPQVRLWGNPLLGKEIRDKSLQHAYRNPWTKIISWKQRIALSFVNLMLLAGFAGFAFLMMSHPASGRNSVSRKVLPGPIIQGMKVDPGDIDVERGSSLTISATFGKESPLDVQLVLLTKRTNEESNISPVEQTAAMRRSLKDPIYSQLVSDIRQDTSYFVRYDNMASETYKIIVFDYPELVRSDAILKYPSYTELPDNKIENTKRARMVAGTELKWELHLNKPIQLCKLTDPNGQSIESVVSESDPLVHYVTMSPTETAKWKVELTDEAGRHAKLESFLHVTVVPNLPPTIKLTAGADRSVSPLEEWRAAADIADDYGIVNYGVGFIFNDEEKDLTFDGNKAKKTSASNQFSMEAISAKPDDLLTYWFWAEDYDAEGNIRRTSSDLFFAEVRPFEEIFRQGEAQSRQQQQQQQQQSGASQQAEELLKLQKQIISATWNLSRRDETIRDFAEADLATLLESQTAALEQLVELKSELQDARSTQAAAAAEKAMQSAVEVLSSSNPDNWKEKSPLALASEQKAYQGLLQLRAREHEIAQSQNQNRSQSQGASQQQRQQQIDQLQLDQNQERYETQSQASEPAQQEQAQAEREAQNRLKELAQRQSDLNEQIQQLEAALQQAQSEQEKRDVEEQLKRLREAQEELLSDTDELLEDMNQQQQSEALQQAAEQTQQSRESQQQAAENLREGRTSEALSAGTRAQQNLDQTQEQLRQNSADALSDSLRDLRSQARDLVERQEEIKQSMENRGPTEESAGLRTEVSKEDLQANIEAQREQLKTLQDALQETVMQAEQSEPLVADSLYQTFQDSQRERLDEKLQAQSQLMDRAMPDEAKQLAEQSLEKMQVMQKQIESTASDVLGSELADLERAASNLERLREQIDRELGRNRNANNDQQPNQESEPNREASPNGQNASPNGQPTENQEQQGAENRNSNANNPEQQQNGNSDQQSSDQQESTPSDSNQANQQPSQSGEQPDQPQQQGNGQTQNGQPTNEQQPENGQPSPQGTPSQERSEQQNQTSGNQNPAGQQRNGQPAGNQRQGRGSSQQSGPGGLGGIFDQLEQATQGQAASEERPLTGEGFRQFNEALRDVGQLLEDREDRALAENIRQAARQMRSDFTRHSKEPQQELVEKLVATPLDELIDRVGLELQRKRAGNTAIVPLDNDPVPPGYDRAVQVYYENLGAGR